jgi:hypothetical protein
LPPQMVTRCSAAAACCWPFKLSGPIRGTRPLKSPPLRPRSRRLLGHLGGCQRSGQRDPEGISARSWSSACLLESSLPGEKMTAGGARRHRRQQDAAQINTKSLHLEHRARPLSMAS